MKKQLALLLALITALSLTACGSKTDDAETAKDPAEEPTTQAPETPEEPEEPEAPEETEEPEKPEATPLKLGETIDNELFLMTFDTINVVPEYSYSTSEHSTTSLYVEDGYQLLTLEGHFENRGTSTISDSAFYFTATVNDTFVVDGFDVRMDFKRNKSFEIDPYTDMDYVVYVNIPQKLAETFESVTFTIAYNDDLSSHTIVTDMDGNQSVEADHLYSLSSAAGDATAAGTAATAEPAAQPIAIGDLITTNDYEFTLKKVELSYEVLPPNTSSVYTSYPAESGKVSVHVEADVKNTMQRDLRIDELFTASVLYDGQYPYDGFTIVNDGDNSFDWVGSYTAATPLETCIAHAIVECPAEVDTSGKSILVTLDLGGAQYEYALR